MTETDQSVNSTTHVLFRICDLGHWNLPFDFAQGDESFDFAQDREPVEPFVI
jgi:hypothetical protein